MWQTVIDEVTVKKEEEQPTEEEEEALKVEQVNGKEEVKRVEVETIEKVTFEKEREGVSSYGSCFGNLR